MYMRGGRGSGCVASMSYWPGLLPEAGVDEQIHHQVDEAVGMSAEDELLWMGRVCERWK